MGIPVKRYDEIMGVLVKYGFEVAVKHVLPGTIKFQPPKKQVLLSNPDVCRRLRLAVQELGPTFVKFAQIISTRRELFPPELINEFKELTNKVEPVGWELIKPVIEERCGPIGEAFSYVDEQPFAAASLSQAHLAKLKDGTVIVLKVQRPNIRKTIDTDLQILTTLAAHLDKTYPELQVYNLPCMVHEFGHQITAELDFVKDGENTELAAANLSGMEGVRVPKVYWEYTGENVLALEYVKGVRLDKVEALKTMGIDLKDIAFKGFRVFMKQIFEDGFFHGDPHPGNLLVTQDGELVILDFGLVGILRPEKRDLLLRLMVDIVDKDVDDLVKTLQDLGVRIDVGVDALKDELYIALMGEMAPSSVKNNTAAFENVVSTLRRYHIKMPAIAMLMVKVILMVDGDGRLLVPDFDFVNESKPIIAEMAATRMLRGANIRKAAFTFLDTVKNTSDLPKNINDAFKTVSSGQFTLKIAHDDLDRLGKNIDHASYKTLLGMTLASVVIGLSLVVVSMRDVLSYDLFLSSVFAYLFSISVGIYSVYHLIHGK